MQIRKQAGGITGSHPTGDFSRAVGRKITRYIFMIFQTSRAITKRCINR